MIIIWNLIIRNYRSYSQQIWNLIEGFLDGQFNFSSSTSTSSHTPTPGGLFPPLLITPVPSTEEYENFNEQKVFKEVVHPTLHVVFTKLIWNPPPKLPTETLKNYMFNQNPPPSNREWKVFDNDQQAKIDRNPECNKFDINLLIRSMQLSEKYSPTLKACPYFTEKFTKNLKLIKKIRNELAHDLLQVEMTKIPVHLRKLKVAMKDLLILVGFYFRCKKDTDAQYVRIKKGIDDIMKFQPSKVNGSSKMWRSLFFISLIINVAQNLL